MVAYPKTIVSIVASIGGLAVFLVICSLFMVSQPIGSTVRGYFYNLDNSRQFDSVSWANKDSTKSNTLMSGGNDINSHDLKTGIANSGNSGSSMPGDSESVANASGDVTHKSVSGESNTQQGVASIVSSAPTVSEIIKETVDQPAAKNPLFPNVSEEVENDKPPVSHSPNNSSNQTGSIDSGITLTLTLIIALPFYYCNIVMS